MVAAQSASNTTSSSKMKVILSPVHARHNLMCDAAMARSDGDSSGGGPLVRFSRWPSYLVLMSRASLDHDLQTSHSGMKSEAPSTACTLCTFKPCKRASLRNRSNRSGLRSRFINWNAGAVFMHAARLAMLSGTSRILSLHISTSCDGSRAATFWRSPSSKAFSSNRATSLPSPRAASHSVSS